MWPRPPQKTRENQEGQVQGQDRAQARSQEEQYASFQGIAAILPRLAEETLPGHRLQVRRVPAPSSERQSPTNHCRDGRSVYGFVP